MVFRTLSAALLAIVVLGGLGSRAEAATISHTDSIPLAEPDWSGSISVPKFDSSLGTLNSVTCKLTGHAEGSAKFESLDTQPASVTMQLSAIVQLRRPDSSTLVISIPVTDTSDAVDSFDGILDFGGTSGKTYSNLSADLTENATHSLAADLALFTGTGSITLPVTADGASTGTGAGNLVLQFAMAASADVEIIYDYSVPEPGTLGLMSLGTLGMIRRRR